MNTYFKLMLSDPAAIPNVISPDLILCAMLRIDMRPDEHSRFTVDIGTVWGKPAANAAALER